MPVTEARKPLPVDAYLDAIRSAVRERGAVVVVAEPGAGKTTRVAPAMCVEDRVILLQPRRVAARAIARRIASEQGWTLGEQIGWQVRFETNACERTRLLVATEGVLTARLIGDPLLSDFGVVVLDEFHERSLHADLALALARQAARARKDLRIVVMSATLDARPVARYLDDCPIIEVADRPHPVEMRHEPMLAMADAVRAALERAGGHVLCFLPGAGEIRRVENDLRARPLPKRTSVLPLHGSLDADAQDRALAHFAGRKVILATNVAETSLTVDGVTDVIDGGRHKILRFNPAHGIDRLEVERISADSAKQRAGRAGRTQTGRVTRLWDERERLRAHREPEIARIDLSGPVLDVMAWGGDPFSFEWFDPPNPERVRSALSLLERLGAAREGRITPLGKLLQRIPLHPRISRVLFDAGGTRRAARACALLSERPWTSETPATTDSDVLSRLDQFDQAPVNVKRAAEALEALARRFLDHPLVEDDVSLRHALFTGFPDRVAQRREPGSSRLVMASGHGAVLSRESGVRSGEFVIALDVAAGRRGPGAEALVRQASRVEREWLEPTVTDVVHDFDARSGMVRAIERRLYDALVLEERAVQPDPARASELLAEALLGRDLSEKNRSFMRRCILAGITIDLPSALRAACAGHTKLPDIDLRRSLSPPELRDVERHCPERLAVPSGRRVRLDYRENGSVHVAVKLQELFGLVDTPHVGQRREAVVIDLLAPNGRPVQTTRDLRGFWERTYPEVRKELRGRYPRHPWPEDPLRAEPTARTKKRR
jgi:ATP-dependent helicase HrpB